jgi:hypothetical protein
MSDLASGAAAGDAGLRITAGQPTPQETAAVIVVLTALAARTAADGAPARAPRSSWNEASRALRPALRPGPGAWRASGLPG